MNEDLTPDISEIRKNFPSSETFNKTKPTAAQEEFLQKLRQEIISEQKRAQEVLPATKKAVEDHGYLYHFAGKSARESIESKGILPGQAQGGQKSFFYLDPYNKNISEFVNAQELDLYRVPVDKQIIEQLQVDPKLGINGETAKSVFLEGDLAKQGLKAERISSKVSLAPGTGEIIFDLKNKKPINQMTGKQFDPTLPMFHGTSSSFNLGDIISPAQAAGVDSVHSSEHLPNLTSNAFATQDIDRARAYAEKAAKKSGGSPLVYRVEPVDLSDLAFDIDAPDDSSWMSGKGFRVVSPAETEATGKTAVEFANGSIHYAPDGRSYFLHHSPNSTIEIGEKIRTAGFKQVTATDAVMGHSYAWDARTGLGEAVANQVSNRGTFLPKGKMPYDYSVYLTSADTKNVFPDINVPDSPARAIKGEQTVLDRISIPSHLSDSEASDLIEQMMSKHGVFAEKSSAGRDIIDRSIYTEKGYEAIDNYVKGANDVVNNGIVNTIEEQISTGGRRGMYASDIPEGHWAYKHSLIADEYEKGGREAVLAYMEKMTPEKWGTDITNYTARVAQNATTGSDLLLSKATEAEKFLMQRGSSRLVEASMDASAAVAGGVGKSGLLRDAASAMTILRKRI